MSVLSLQNRLFNLTNIGRGVDAYDFPVELEPVLSQTIFSGNAQRPLDDGRIPSSFTKLLTSGRSKNVLSSETAVCKPDANYRPAKNLDLPGVSFRVNLPKELKISNDQTSQMLLNLANSASIIGLEIIGTSDFIAFQFACRENERTAVYSQLKTHLPVVNVEQGDDLLRKFLRIDRLSETVSTDFGLVREWFLPLPLAKNFSSDPLLPLIASFEQIKSGEIACLQVLFSRVRQNWQRAAQTVITDRNGKLTFTNAQSISGIKEKISQPLLAVSIKFLAQSDSREMSIALAKTAMPFFREFATPVGNELIPQGIESLSAEDHIRSFLSRTTHRTGMLLSLSELSSIAHLPSDAIASQKLDRETNTTKSAPEFATKGNVVLGVNKHHGRSQTIRLSNKDRMKGLWLLGATGSGKSSTIISLAEQDMIAGHGLCVIEPHGDLIEDILARVPTHRLMDVVLFDPSADCPVPFNFLNANSELERTLLSSDLVAVFRQFSQSWGDVIETLLHNAVLAFLSSTKGGTLIDLRHFLIDKDFRDEFLKTVTDEEIRFYWQKEFPQMGGKPHGPLLTRIDTFLRSKLIRNVVAQKASLEVRRIMDERKILLVKLTHGAIGQEQSYMLGSLIMSKLYQAALSRQDTPEQKRPDFFIYADEAHHFIVPSTSLLLSGGRKFHCSLLFSNQETRQILSRDPEVLSSLLTNCFTRVCFRLDSDAELLSKGFSFFTAEHLKNLGVGEAICRLEQSRYDFNLHTIPLEPVDADTAYRRRKIITEHTRSLFVTSNSTDESQSISRQPIKSTEDKILPDNSIKDHTVGGTEKEAIDEPKEIAVESKQSFGRAGQHHQELQAVIKRVAETYGFRVAVEQGIEDGTGRVDVSLEKENVRIACEVSVTTTDYEITNILKCLGDGYDHVIVVVSNQKKLPLINSKIQSEIPVGQQGKVKAFGLTGLLGFLRELCTSTELVKGKSEKKAGQRLNFAEACEFYGVTSSTLYRWVREGRVPFYRPGREYQFDRDELVLTGRHDLSGKRKTSVKLSPLTIEKKAPKGKKQQDSRYRKLLKLD